MSRDVFDPDAAPTVENEQSQAEPVITGSFSFVLSTPGSGGGTVSTPADGFSLDYEQADLATRWAWQPDDSSPETEHTCRVQRSESPFNPEQLSEDEARDAATRSECAAAAFKEVDLPLIQPSAEAGAVIDLDDEQLRASNEATDYRSELAEGRPSYGPFVFFQENATTVAADANGNAVWVSHWDGRTQWTITSLK